jgi:ParB family chromosome partitioning protein
VVIRDVDDTEIIEVALVENIQRRDLGPFEEAEAMSSLASRCGYTHEDLAKRLGKSRTVITESLALANMPDQVRNVCRLADISSKSLLLQIVRQQTPEKMLALIERLTRDGDGGQVTREHARKAVAKPKLGRPKAFVFNYRPPTKLFNLKLQFRKADVERGEVIAALEAIIEELRQQR